MDCSADLLTKEDCHKIIRDLTKNENVVLHSYLTTKLSTIEGLVGEHYKLKIIYEEGTIEKETNLFAKIVFAPFKAMTYLIKSIKAYEKEEFYFNYLLKEFEACGLSTAFAPKFYYCRQPLLILEDLSIRKYVNAPKKDMLDTTHCKVALRTLAKFHATTISYEKIKSSTDNTFTNLEEMYPDLLEDVLYSDRKNAATEWLECTFKGILALIDLLPKSDISAETFISTLLEIFQTPKSNSKTSITCINTVLHGDLWSNNFMFKYENNIPIDSILIDYQILKYGPIASDVMQMILTNVRRDARKEYLEELLSYYYHQFVEACDARGFDAHKFVSYKDFMNSCEEVKIIAKMECIADHSITFLIGESIEEAMQTEEAMYESLFGDRSKTMIHSYQTDALYREIMTEDLIELRDLLFNNN